MALSKSRIYKVAGLSFLGFCAFSIGADRANIGPVASQVAGFCGAFIGALVAPRHRRSITIAKEQEAPQPAHDAPESAQNR